MNAAASRRINVRVKGREGGPGSLLTYTRGKSCGLFVLRMGGRDNTIKKKKLTEKGSGKKYIELKGNENDRAITIRNNDRVRGIINKKKTYIKIKEKTLTLYKGGRKNKQTKTNEIRNSDRVKT